MQIKRQLCKIPDYVEFEYKPEQELHAFIEIQNLVDQIVSYKIKTTAPVEYLVKPMEGQIYHKEKAKVVFKRKKLSFQNFQAIQNGTRPLKEKFMFVLTCKYKNAIGIEKVQESSHIMNVKFGCPKRPNPDIDTSRVQHTDIDEIIYKKVKKVKTPEQRKQEDEMKALIVSERAKLEGLKAQRKADQDRLQGLQSAIDQASSSGENAREVKAALSGQLSLNQIICLIVLAFLLGMLI